MAVQVIGQLKVKRRAAGGAAGAPDILLSGEVAYNETDDTLYIGYGDNGSGVATSIRAFAGAGRFATKTYVDDALEGAGAGSVTSVGLSAPTGFTVSNSPVTSTGTLTMVYTSGYRGYTDTEATKLAGIATGANLYTHPTSDGNRHIPTTSAGQVNMFLRAGTTAGSASVWTALSTVAVTGAYNDLSGRPTLGTLAAKNAALISDVTGLQAALDAKLATTQAGAAGGLATLDGSGKLTSSQLPESVLGSMRYQGTWNASTNSPAIPAAAEANRGWYYVVQTAGTTTISGINDWEPGDWIVSSGTRWDKLDNTDQVMTVAGQKGNVVLTHTDIGGLGTMATQSAGAVNITGGTIDNVVLDGGTF